MIRTMTLLLALLLSLPAVAQTRSDEAANALFVEALKARNEASTLAPGDSDIAGWTRKRDLLVQVERNLRDIVDRHAGSGLAVRLMLGEVIGDQISLQRAAREAASAREGLEISQDEGAARRALDALEPSLARARGLPDPGERFAELQRLRPQLADIGRRHPRARQAVAALRVLDTEIERVAVEIAAAAATAAFKSINDAAGIGRVLRDCPDCPEMVVIPAGATRLASGLDVTIATPFAVGKFEVTFAEWDACAAQGGCSRRPDDRRWGRGRQPVMNVDWDDAQQYVAWLSRTTGKTYRLLSEAEWEYAAQAGSGREQVAEAGANQANCDGCGSRWDDKQTAPVGSFAANAFGLHDMLGNVWEWTADCWNASHSGAASDGSARNTDECSRRVLRGGSWDVIPGGARSAFRFGGSSDNRFGDNGFRVARTL